MPDAGSVFDEQASRRLEVLYTTPDIVNQRRQTRRLLAPQPGERILDIGSGPGLLAVELAEDVSPGGHVTGIDLADAMIALSQARCADSPLAERVTFRNADAAALPFDDHSFDAAVAVQVYEYVADVDAALAELYRVLKPGGRALILDTDWDSIVWNATHAQLMRRVLDAWTGRFAHPHLPRTLSCRLKAAGFAIDDRVVLVLFNPAYDSNTYSVAHLDIMSDFVLRQGTLGAAEVQAWRDDLEALGHRSAYFFSLNRYTFLAHTTQASSPIAGNRHPLACQDQFPQPPATGRPTRRRQPTLHVRHTQERGSAMDKIVRVITELALRRQALQLDRSMLVARLQMRCEHAQGLDGRTLRDWEQRLHIPSPIYQAMLCDYFKVDSVAELGLGDSLEAAHHWTWRPKPERKREVRRRQLLRLSVHATAASFLPVPALTAAAQILGGRRRLDQGDVDTARQVATHLAASYAATPDRAVTSAAHAHAYTLNDLLKRASMPAQVRIELTVLAADAMSLAGYGDLNAGRLAQADAWFAEALRLARDANDRRLEAHVLASRAWMPLYAPDPDRAKVLAGLEAAAEHERWLPPAGQAWLCCYLARERAALGDDLGSGRLLEQAHAAAARVQGADPGWGWWSTYGDLDIRPEVFTGTRSLLLGRPAEAIEIYTIALDGATTPILRSTLHQRLMESCIALDDPDRACASAHAALDEADTHELALWPQEIRKARLTFPPQWNTLTPIIDLDDRLGLAG